MLRLRAVWVVTFVALAVMLAGCGSTQIRSRSGAEHSGAQASAVSVIRGWSSALRRGDISVAARYFALPSVFSNGFDSNGNPLAVEIRTERQARAVNDSLSCGAQLISTSRHGKYIAAAFRLTNRSGPGAGCGSGTGDSASTDFVITNGRILAWIRAPTGGAAPKIPTVPASSQSPGQPI